MDQKFKTKERNRLAFKARFTYIQCTRDIFKNNLKRFFLKDK